MALRDVQKRLNSMGFDVGPADGLYGRRTEGGLMAVMDMLAGKSPKPPVDASSTRVVPLAWMPMARMHRIINHWSAGAYRMGAASKKHYHLGITGPVAKLERGNNSIKANEKIKGAYAAHTRGINTGSIGVSCMSMANATESPFTAGRYPLTESQWNMMVRANADLCDRYHIEVTEDTVLSHAEVQANLGVWQRAKWDFTRMPHLPKLRGAKAIGDEFRRQVQALL